MMIIPGIHPDHSVNPGTEAHAEQPRAQALRPPDHLIIGHPLVPNNIILSLFHYGSEAHGSLRLSVSYERNAFSSSV